MGNRIYGCDDCQLICRDRYSQLTTEDDFSPRKPLHAPESMSYSPGVKAFKVTEEVRRFAIIGHLRWLRNIAVAIGNAWDETICSLESRKGDDERMAWALRSKSEANACVNEVQLQKQRGSDD